MKSLMDKMKSLMDKMKELIADIDWDCWANYAMEKLRKSLETSQEMGNILMKKADEVFPPEARAEQIQKCVHAAKPYLKPGAALLLTILFCRFFFGGGGGGGGKMMKAPGRNTRIRRAAFQSNPKGYFRSLRE